MLLGVLVAVMVWLDVTLVLGDVDRVLVRFDVGVDVAVVIAVVVWLVDLVDLERLLVSVVVWVDVAVVL